MSSTSQTIIEWALALIMIIVCYASYWFIGMLTEDKDKREIPSWVCLIALVGCLGIICLCAYFISYLIFKI